jgi:nuclear pore complex protein Nup133
MFSAEPTRRESLRPKRTRQAAGSEDSIKLPQAKRKRSALRRDTFEPLAEASINEVAGRDIVEGRSNGHPVVLTQSKELTFRGSKKVDKRVERSTTANAGLTLSNNDFYTVSQLPALPDQIRNRPTIPYTCVISPEYGYALALTHTDAIIWPYNSAASTLPTRDVTSFRLPFPPAAPEDPLPLATFTARSASGEPGLVAVSAKWGKIVYWETISNASSVIPGQTSGVQGSIPGLMGGEVVQDLVNAEPSGFMLSLRHGRVVHLTVRNQLGQPAIGVQFLRKSSYASSGIFGSIRTVLGADRRKGVPIVKAGASRKGQRDVVVASEDAELEFWNTSLTNGNSLATSFSFREQILEAMRPDIPELHDVKVLDIELSAGPSTVVAKKDDNGAPMMALVSASTASSAAAFYILEMVVDQVAKVKAVHPITCCDSSTFATNSTWRPRLCVSRSQPSAYVLFETAIVLFSLARIRDSPTTQLLMERQALPQPFQDCIYFQDATIYKVLGFAPETSDNASSLVFGVQGFGIVRMSSKLRQEEELDVEDVESRDRVSAKSKIEQAVFFGSIKQNPFDLKRADRTYDQAEVEAAALAITSEILSSSSKHLPKSAPSIDMQMRLRAKAFQDLAEHVISNYASLISREVKFELLLQAEKLAAAQAVWKVQEDIQRKYPQPDREEDYLNFVLRALHESRQRYPDPERGENDRVRHWLINSVENVEHLMSELGACFRELEPMSVTDPVVTADYYREAVELWMAAYTAVFKFREDSAPIYGLNDEIFKDGILVDGFPRKLPQPWTSKPEPLRFAQGIIFDVYKFLNEWWEFAHGRDKKKKMPLNIQGKPYEGPSKSTLRGLSNRMPTALELFARVVREESIWAKNQLMLAEQDPAALEDEKANIDLEEQNRLSQALQVVAAFNKVGAIQLAEKLNYFGDLAIIHLSYYHQLTLEIAADPSLRERNIHELEQMRDRAESYYTKFGKGWAYAAFSQMLIDGEGGSLLLKGLQDEQKEEFLTWFFRVASTMGQKLGKLQWLHDVVANDDFKSAEKVLQEVAAEEMSDVWNKKTQLAFAKLAGLAADEGSGQERDLSSYDADVAIIDIQEKVCKHVMASVGAALDDKAAFELAQENFASKVVAKSSALKRHLKQILKALLSQNSLAVDELVDLLTLMDPRQYEGAEEDDPEVFSQEFKLAWKVVELASFPEAKKDDLRASIWRRAMTRDDWLLLNDTAGKDDQQVQDLMQQSALYQALTYVFEIEQTEGTPVHLFSPSDILAREPFPTSLQDKLAENEIEGLRKDIMKEQSRLETFVQKGRLEEHYSGLVTFAQKTVRDAIDAQGEQMAAEEAERQAIEQQQVNGV